VTFADDSGRLLSAQEVKERVLLGKQGDMVVQWHGEVSYPVRVESYYLDVRILFNNVYLASYDPRSLLHRIPPFRYWFGPTWYFERVPRESVKHMVLWNRFYFAVIVGVPVLWLTVVVLQLALVGRGA
jgi:hypothetical protein